MRKPKPVRAWAIVTPEGKIDVVSFGKQGLINNYTTFFSMMTWKAIYAQGYRCIRVKVVPGGEGK